MATSLIIFPRIRIEVPVIDNCRSTAAWYNTLPLEPMLISLGKPGYAVRVRLVVSLGFLAILPFLVTHFGLIGAGSGLVAAAGALALGMLMFLLRENKNRPTPPNNMPDSLKGHD